MFGLDDIILNALSEDIGTGDITSLSTIPADKKAHGRFIAKEDGIICGTDVVERTFKLIDDDTVIKFFVKDGDSVKKGDVLCEVSGKAISLLTAERVSLNFLQHLSGIATRTNQAVEQIKGYNAKIADTRKTTPGLRVLEKRAVKVGGGVNHRFNLADGVLIKDNHIVAAGGIKNAVEAARKNAPHTLKIEVEVENFEMLNEALEAGADIIMLDNMSNEDMAKAVMLINGRAITEASGNMGEKSLKEVAQTGVDLISIGAVTHSVKALDISLKFKMI
ncbi:MAG: carboxylating nicotinate-nucleotide diphosphorylase [Ruminococcaceae bacterium]|nr:carboxylating nicotinate-nucleotide diphosphorylase [Oscillospiraceae bacterium]